MLESLGMALFCGGFFICAVAYAIITVMNGSAGRLLASVKNELSYLSHNEIDRRIDGYLYTLVSVIGMLVAGCIAMIIGMVMVPGLFNCLGMMLIGLFCVSFACSHGTEFLWVLARK